MNVNIQATISIGDAGFPFDTNINVDYEQHGNNITVIDWMEDGSPYDNPPQLWYEQVKEKIADFFYDQSTNYEVKFA